MAIGDEPEPEQPEAIQFLDWHTLYARDDGDEAIIPGLAYRGRWTAVNAPAKEGKSTVILGITIPVARAGITVIYLDAEMGRADVTDRTEYWMHLTPNDLANVHYTDLPPKLNTVQGASMLGAAVTNIGPDLIIIDGLNGVIVGDENDNTPWRDLYEWAIAPCKALGIAVLTIDNAGKDKTLGPRGSSVKLDKADAILRLERTDAGCKLTATHRRTAAYPAVQHYIVAHASDEGPPMVVTPVATSDPDGTIDVIRLLDDLDAADDIGTVAARKLVRGHGYSGRNTVIDAATKTRRNRVPDLGAQFSKTPASRGAPIGGSTCSPPPVSGGGGQTDLDDCEPF